MSTFPTGKRLKTRIYNPHRLKADELEESFIARHELFREMLDDIATSNPASPPQHHLVVGQRGMGKTTLLRRLALELHRPPHCRRFLPLNFAEEQHIEVDRLSKFWLNCLDAMADSLEHEGQMETVRRIDETVDQLLALRADETTYHEACRDAFTAAWQELGRRPVLFVDNFNLLLARLRTEDYALRGYFSAAGAPLLVAASAVYPEPLADYGAAFYDGFKPRYLYPLTLEEVRDVLIHLAQAVEQPSLIDRIYQEMPRIAALRDLTGGNPRTAVLLFELFADGFSEDAFDDLEALLDLVTPLYQTRLDQLSDLAKTIVGTLSRNWRPMTRAEIVDQARLNDSSVPAQLGRLQDLGLVEETEIFPGKKTGYQIAERFFNIWYLMRFTTRRQRASLSCLTRFLEEFHTPAERTRSARELLQRDSLSHGNITYAMALAGAIQDEPALSRELERKAHLELVRLMDGVRERISAILDPDEIHPGVYSFAELRGRLERMVPDEHPVSGREFAELVLGSPSFVPWAGGSAEDIRRRIAAELPPTQIAAAVSIVHDELKRWIEDYSPQAVRWLCARLSTGTLTSWRDAECVSDLVLLAEDSDCMRIVWGSAHIDAKRRLSASAFEKLVTALTPPPDANASTWLTWADFRQLFGHFAEAESACREAIRLDPNSAVPWTGLGNLLQNHLTRYAESEQAYREAIRLNPNYASPRNGLGNLLQYHLTRYAESELAYREAIRLDPNYASPWNGLGNLLQDHLTRYAESEQAYREAIRLNPNYASPWNGLGNLLQDHLTRYAESEQAYREAIRLDPNDALPWNGLGNLLQYHLTRYAESELAYREAIRLDPNYASPWNGLGNLLQDHLTRYAESEQAYREAIRLNPNYVSPWNGLGMLLHHLTRYAESEQAFREAIRLNPNNAIPCNNLGDLLQDHLARYAEAEQTYREAIRLDPNYARPWNNLGNLLRDHLARNAEAEEAYREAIRLNPSSVHRGADLVACFGIILSATRNPRMHTVRPSGSIQPTWNPGTDSAICCRIIWDESKRQKMPIGKRSKLTQTKTHRDTIWCSCSAMCRETWRRRGRLWRSFELRRPGSTRKPSTRRSFAPTRNDGTRPRRRFARRSR